MDKLIIHGLELWLKVGCTEAERAFPQRLEMDVTLEMPLSAAGKSDDLSQSVDYAAVAEALRQKLTPQSFRLIETVAEQARVPGDGRDPGIAVERGGQKR
jgi:dihydroneopterin aldolase